MVVRTLIVTAVASIMCTLIQMALWTCTCLEELDAVRTVMAIRTVRFRKEAEIASSIINYNSGFSMLSL